MGWITNKRTKSGHGIAHGRKTSKRQSAPLRMIVDFVSEGDKSLFGRGDKMLLECGHEVYTKGAHKARCIYCKNKKQ